LQEFFAGGSLANFLKRGHVRSVERGLDFTRILMMLRGVAAGMAHVHAKQIGERSPVLGKASNRSDQPL
jgi:hypothetical protein